MLKIKGRTTSGQVVVGGIFKLIDTHGIPLTEIANQLQNRNFVIDWLDFYEDTIIANWNPDGTLSKIEESLVDTLGSDHANEVLLRLKIYIIQWKPDKDAGK